MTSQCDATVSGTAGAAVLTLGGEIDGGAAVPLCRAYERAVAVGSPDRVVLDFTAVDYINSTGIAVIVSLLGRARSERRQGRLRAVRPLPADLHDYPAVRLHQGRARP